jgi:hypothetical protein
MQINIKFTIDDVMAWHCIEYLMNTGQKVSKRTIIKVCKEHLIYNANRFTEQLEFGDFMFLETPDAIDAQFDKHWRGV